MTRTRYVLAAFLFLTAIPIGVAASVPVVNTADFLILASPFALIWTLWPLIPTRPDA